MGIKVAKGIIDNYNSMGVFEDVPSCIEADVTTIEGMNTLKDKIIGLFQVCLKKLPIKEKVGVKYIELYYKDAPIPLGNSYSCTITNRGFLETSCIKGGRRTVGVVLSNAVANSISITNINTVDVSIDGTNDGLLKVVLRVLKVNNISLFKTHIDYLKSVVCSYVDRYKKVGICVTALKLDFIEKGSAFTPLGGCLMGVKTSNSNTFSTDVVDSRIYDKVVDLNAPVCRVEYKKPTKYKGIQKGCICLKSISSKGREFCIKFTDC